MSRASRLSVATIGLVSVILAGCFGGEPGASAPGTSAAASARASAAEASLPASSQAASSEPSEEDLGPFSCELPLHVDATVGRANIVDVRTATHAGYDRVVFEFSDGLPESFIERATPPFAHDASGEPIDVEGSGFLRLTLRGGTKQMDDGSSSYDGPVAFATEFPSLVHLIEGGDFEGQSTWYLGLTSEACVRTITLDDDEARLVIDIEH